MSANVYFPIVDSNSNPLSGSKVTIRPLAAPYFFGINPVGSSAIPDYTYTDSTGSAYFATVVPGIYKVSWTGPNFNNPPIYKAYTDTFIYVNLPDTSGSLIDGFNYIITASATNNSQSSVTSASYSLSASYALNGGSSVSCSWASQSLSASYALSSSYTPNLYPQTYQASGSWASSSLSSSFAIQSISSSYSVSASYTPQTIITTVPSASWASQSLSASYAPYQVSSSYASTASYVATASYYPSFPTSIATASFAINAVSASVSTFSFNRTEDIDNGLIVYYPFAEGTGSIIHDYSISGLNAINLTASAIIFSQSSALNAIWNSSSYKAGGYSLQMDGMTSAPYAVPIPSISGLPALTVAIWVNTTASIITPTMLAAKVGSGGTGGEWFLEFNSGVVWSVTNTTPTRNDLTVAIPLVNDGKWHYVVATYNGIKAQQLLYVDGKLIGSATVISGSLQNTNQPLQIGCFSFPIQRIFSGLMDEFKMWNRDLSIDEIRANWLQYPNSIQPYFDAYGNEVISGSLTVTNGITGSLNGIAAQALTASYVSYNNVVNIPSGDIPYGNGTGPLNANGNLTFNGTTLSINGNINTTDVNPSTIAGIRLNAADGGGNAIYNSTSQLGMIANDGFSVRLGTFPFNLNTLIVTQSRVGIGGISSPNNSLDVLGNISCSVITASLFGTSSYANTATSASYFSGSTSNSNSSSYALTASYALNAIAPVFYDSTNNSYYGISINGTNGNETIQVGQVTYNSQSGVYSNVSSSYSLTSSYAARSLSSSYSTQANTSYGLDNQYVQTLNGLQIQDADGSNMGISGGGINIIYNPLSSVYPFILNNMSDQLVAGIDGNGNNYGSAFIWTGSYYNTVTSSYTIKATDNGKMIVMTGGSTCVLNVPSGLPQGFGCTGFQSGSGQVIIVGTGATINNRAGLSGSYARWSQFSIVSTALNCYILSGDLR